MFSLFIYSQRFMTIALSLLAKKIQNVQKFSEFSENKVKKDIRNVSMSILPLQNIQ